MKTGKSHITIHLNLKFVLVLSISLIMLGSCIFSNNRIKSIPDKALIEIIKDMHIADATFQTTKKRSFRNTYDSIQFYDTIFQKHGYTRQQFDSTVNRLTKDPEHYISIYEKVMADLTTYEAELEEKAKEIKELYFKSNLWNKKENWNLPSDGEQEKLEFDIPLKGVGEYFISAKIRMYKDDGSMNPKITAYFFKEDSTELGQRQYFPSMSINKNNVLREYKVRATLADSTFTTLHGALLDHSNTDEDWKKHVFINEIKVLFIPKEE